MSTHPDFEFSVPVIVAGGGACGMSAALALRDAGIDVLVLERDKVSSGSTGMSQGMICGAGTKMQASLGISDTPDALYADIMEKVHSQTDPVIARTIAEQSGPTLDWLVERWSIPLELDELWQPRYGHTAKRLHGWIGHTGQELLDLMVAKATEAGAMILNEARLADVHTDANGQVVGVRVERPGGIVEHIGCAALVLATCGFGGNRELVARYMPEAAKARYHGHEGNKGDGILIGEKLGAQLSDMGAYQGYGMLTEPSGITSAPNLIMFGGVLVNATGQRFVDELEDVSGLVHHVLSQPGGVAWLVFDAHLEAMCQRIPDVQQMIDLGASRPAANFAELAAIIGAPEEVVARTMQDVARIRAGEKPDPFGRRFGESFELKPPYRAAKVTGALYHTQGGLQINEDAQVMRPDGTVLPNLFAGGGAARGVSGPGASGYLPAMGLCTAVTLGRVAGLSAARLTSRVDA